MNDATHLRLVVCSDDEPVPHGEHGRWASEPRSLLALAVALEHLVGALSPVFTEWTEETAAWHARYRRAIEILSEVANSDAELLRSLIAPAPDIGRQPGRGLLVAAAITLEGSR